VGRCSPAVTSPAWGPISLRALLRPDVLRHKETRERWRPNYTRVGTKRALSATSNVDFPTCHVASTFTGLKRGRSRF
jgi:hypothetical protein